MYDYLLLDNIQEAVSCYLKHLENKSNIHIVVDSDTDGYTSASIIYKYTQLISDNQCNITYSIHTQKEHGLSKDIVIPQETNLLIIPDASSNDIEQCKALKERGIDIIVLDHHECDIKNPYAIIVNNQMCDYPNKQLCGAAIVYKFLQAVDDETWNSHADIFLDLVALGLIADNMDVKSLETRLLINKGMGKIRNKFLKALIDKQSYSLGNDFTSKDIQFYVVPLINGMIRAGDSDEKDLLFRAFIETGEIFKYKKRGDTVEIDENIYDRTARLCGNAKSRQNTVKDKSLLNIFNDIEKRGYDKNKIIFCNVTNLLDENMTGVVAIKVAEHYGKPCLLLRKKKNNENLYGGSGRNIDDSPIENLKDFLNELNIFELVQGHQGAFGIEIKKENIPVAIELINEKLKDVDFTVYLDVDFIIGEDELTIGLVKNIDELRHFYGTGFKEPLIAVEQLEVRKDQFSLMGKDSTNWKVTTDEGVALVRFKIDEEDCLKKHFESSDESVFINVAGRTNINNYKGILTSQLIVVDYEIVR